MMNPEVTADNKPACKIEPSTAKIAWEFGNTNKYEGRVQVVVIFLDKF